MNTVNLLLNELNQFLLNKYADRLLVETQLPRAVVSFQNNKSQPFYRWFKFKEAFSADLVNYFLGKYPMNHVLDPFCGSGTTLLAASSRGVNATGVELLPLGQTIMDAQQAILQSRSVLDLLTRLEFWRDTQPWRRVSPDQPLPELVITRGAYPPETQTAIRQYLTALQSENDLARKTLLLALLGVLEAVSYTRKDGQYLRWDYRSGRNLSGKPFYKGEIVPFERAITHKLSEIVEDIQTVKAGLKKQPRGNITLLSGSALRVLPTLPDHTFDGLITSPPYCNRYDYTRTYSLELALLGVGEKEIRSLRQEMISSTVENRPKDLMSICPAWRSALLAVEQQALLDYILQALQDLRKEGRLNNAAIPHMVRGYFYEMSCLIYEFYRLLKPGSKVIIVNDNVRYAGISIPLDLIFSEIAEQIGFVVENILVSPSKKGNSSQQMGEVGVEWLRKSVYVWSKPFS